MVKCKVSAFKVNFEVCYLGLVPTAPKSKGVADHSSFAVGGAWTCSHQPTPRSPPQFVVFGHPSPCTIRDPKTTAWSLGNLYVTFLRRQRHALQQHPDRSPQRIHWLRRLTMYVASYSLMASFRICPSFVVALTF